MDKNVAPQKLTSPANLSRLSRLETAGNDASPFEEAIALFKQNIGDTQLLSSQEEHVLARTMSKACKDIALKLAERAPKLFFYFNAFALNKSLKKTDMPSHAQYFVLRRELDELINAKENSTRLRQLIESHLTPNLTLIQRNRSPLDSETIKIIKEIDWPGPLLVALAEFYDKQKSCDSLLATSLKSFFPLNKLELENHIEPATSEDLNKSIQTYLNARDQLVTRNLRLVFFIAKKYTSKPEYINDLVQEGCIGLIRAAEKFRANSGNRFSTYACHWIASNMRTAFINVDRIVHAPTDLYNISGRITKYLDRNNQIGISSPRTKLKKALRLRDEHLDQAMQLSQQTNSFDSATTDELNLNLHSKIADEHSDFFKRIETEKTMDAVDKLMNIELTQRESHILNARHERIKDTKQTLEQLGLYWGITDERVRQLEASALKKVKSRINS